MLARLKLSHHRHSGSILPHAHTSYAALAFLVLLAGVLLAGMTAAALADHPAPQSGSVGLSGKVPGPPPSAPAIINIPKNGQHFGSSPITVSGTCAKSTMVEIFKNQIFAGATPCQDDQTFNTQIDMLYGSNVLMARVYDALDQAGPDSNGVTVYYDALPAQGAPLDGGNLNDLQLLLRTSPVFRGAFPGDQFNLPVELIGGQPPFAVNIDWGDNKNDLITRTNNSPFEATHAYSRPGTYNIVIRASDAKQRMAFLTVVSIINGRAEILNNTQLVSSGTNKLLLAWPLYILAVGMVASFWMGERMEKHRLADMRPF